MKTEPNLIIIQVKFPTMAVTSLGFELLPALSEGEEHISLCDLLLDSTNGMEEKELWAICSQCCTALESIEASPDMFQLLCVTLFSLAFDASGSVCFLDIGSGR